jgi:hypothetical protein
VLRSYFDKQTINRKDLGHLVNGNRIYFAADQKDLSFIDFQ